MADSSSSAALGTLIPALLLAAVAVFAAIVLVRPLLMAVIGKAFNPARSGKGKERGALRSWFTQQRWSISALKSRAAQRAIERESSGLADQLQRGDFAAAQRSLKGVVELVCSMPTLSPEGVVAQLLSTLSQLMVLAEKHQIHLENLEQLEELVQERGAILRAVLEAERSRRAFKRRKSEQGKEVPEWALVELKKQFEKLQNDLASNRVGLHQQFGESLQLIIQARSRISMTVH